MAWLVLAGAIAGLAAWAAAPTAVGWAAAALYSLFIDDREGS